MVMKICKQIIFGEPAGKLPARPAVIVMGGALDEKRVQALLDRAIASYTGIENPVAAWKHIVPVGKVIGLKVNGLGGKGIATHAVLQHLDFPSADATLQQQIDAMVQRHQLTPAQAHLVDQESIRWLLGTATDVVYDPSASRAGRRADPDEALLGCRTPRFRFLDRPLDGDRHQDRQTGGPERDRAP